MSPTVVLVGSLDTKAREYEFVRERLLKAGVDVVLVDFGILVDPPYTPDVTAEEVARAGGKSLGELRFAREGSDTRAVALATMERGVGAILRKLYDEKRCDAVFGMGGSGGSSVISAAMRTLPIGVPKLLLSTMASGNISGYVGTRDLAVMYSITDIAGLNRVSRKILTNAAMAVAGMAKGVAPGDQLEDRPLVAVTMFGITTPGVLRIVEQLENSGFETIVFHATGSGGRAMEEMIADGLIDGVIDYTTSELVDELLGGVFSAGPTRLEAAGKAGIPQVVVPGALEVLNFGARDTLPQKYDKPERKLIVHNPFVCAVRTNLEESRQLGEIFATRLNKSTGPVTVMLPLDGLDKYEQPPDGPWIDPEKDQALFDAIKRTLRKDIPVIEMDANINDHKFADATFKTFLKLWQSAHSDQTGASR